jgi:hypothetical protein
MHANRCLDLAFKIWRGVVYIYEIFHSADPLDPDMASRGGGFGYETLVFFILLHSPTFF